MKYNVSDEEFLEAWQSSETLEEVANLLGMPKEITSARASAYRVMGLDLKRFGKRRRNRGDLQKLLEEVNRRLALSSASVSGGPKGWKK